MSRWTHTMDRTATASVMGLFLLIAVGGAVVAVVFDKPLWFVLTGVGAYGILTAYDALRGR